MIDHPTGERRVLSALHDGKRVDLQLDGQHVRGELLAELLAGQESVRSFRLSGAHIEGRLDLSAAKLDFPVEFRDCHFDDRVVLTEAELASLRLPGCRIPALDADQIQTTGNFEFPNARCGPVTFVEARIRGRFRFDDTHLDGDGGAALTADRMQVEQGIFGKRSIVDGRMTLNHARVGGQVVLDESRLTGEPWALKANGMSCEAYLGLQRIVARGDVRLIGTKIGGSLVLLDAALHRPGGWALLCIETEAQLVTLRPTADSAGVISLRDARFARFTDDPPNWPENCRIELTGLTYQRLTRRSSDLASCPVPTRLEWMKRYSVAAPAFETGPERAEFSPAPYTQLANALRADGLEREAREVHRFKERHRHRNMGPLGAIWGALQDITVGFGHRPALALAWLVGLLGSGTVYFALVGPLRAVKKDEFPTWDPFLYSLDLLVPLVDLGHEKAWDPTGWSKTVALILIVGGWILATAVVAGAGRVLNRQAS